ncbi:kanadaptin isoform X2 [Rhynchophorus ferrugineus]|uniref:kanadaptin isoform X2 n=1 Tax=Rhynchophorus ferrugineus TaxID=354439 RepID=UPI003FCD910B
MESEQTKTDGNKQNDPFKKPTLLIGKIRRVPKKLQPISLNKNLADVSNKSSSSGQCVNNQVQEVTNHDSESNPKQNLSPAQLATENNVPLPYKEPTWSGLPETSGRPYIFEVLKNGTIIETIDLMKKPYWVFGRLNNCDICMQHPTISRYHAVLQYRDVPTESDPPGFYLYDLGSTHGTFLNGKNKLKPKIYVPVRVGHMIRLGCSQRSYILTGPEDDEDEESELSVTELKQLRIQKIAERQEKLRKQELEREERLRKEEERGVDWGLGDDADENDDLSENPYAQTTNEELYLDDPKKTLRGFFEREGLDLEYDCTEQGMGQFLCKIVLPLDDDLGKPMVAEVLHRGKKKEAVEQCALEACRILDRFGVLRQATHESRKRKVKNWEENDYYDSDEDTFLDRTGTIEKKREKRMKAKEPEKAETYESLLEKEKAIISSITEIEKRLDKAQAQLQKEKEHIEDDDDSLDSYMKSLQEEKLDKHMVSKLKMELVKLKKDHEQIKRLINIAKPASLPSLTSQAAPQPSTSKVYKFPYIGKRKGYAMKFPQKPVTQIQPIVEKPAEDVSEKDEEVVETTDTSNDANKLQSTGDQNNEHLKDSAAESMEQSVSSDSEDSQSGNESNGEDDSSKNKSDILELASVRSFHESLAFEKFEMLLKSGLPPTADKYKEPLEKVLNNLKRLASNEDRLQTDWRILSAKKRKVLKLMSDLRKSMNNQSLKNKVSLELKRIMEELDAMTVEKFKVVKKVHKMGDVLKNISVEIGKEITELSKTSQQPASLYDNPTPGTSSSSGMEPMESEGESSRSRDKLKRKEEKRKREEEFKKQRGYEEDAKKDDYCMWVPPTDQSGDGRTALNDKLGY